MGDETEIRESNILQQDRLMSSSCYRSAHSVLTKRGIPNANEIALEIADTDRVIEEKYFFREIVDTIKNPMLINSCMAD